MGGFLIAMIWKSLPASLAAAPSALYPPKKEPHDLHLHPKMRRQHPLHRLDHQPKNTPKSPQPGQRRQIHPPPPPRNPRLLRSIPDKRRSHAPGSRHQKAKPPPKGAAHSLQSISTKIHHTNPTGKAAITITEAAS